MKKLNNSKNWITKDGVLAEAFPVKSVDDEENFTIDGDLIKISKNFNKESKLTPFKNSGIMIEKKVSTLKTESVYKGKKLTLGSVLVKDKVDKEFYLDRKDLEQWKYLKGAKKIELFIIICFFSILVTIAIMALTLNHLFAVIMLSGAFSLVSAMLFVVMDAVDVAFTGDGTENLSLSLSAATGRALG